MTQCTICLEEHTDFKLECGHSFHNKCICEWLMCNSNSCPTCRKQIIKNKQTKEIDLPFTNNLFIADDHNVPEYILDTVLELAIDEIIRYSDNDEDLSNWVNVSGVSITYMYYKKKAKTATVKNVVLLWSKHSKTTQNLCLACLLIPMKSTTITNI